MLRDMILEAVRQVRGKEPVRRSITNDVTVNGRNEFLFFVKPELLLDRESLRSDAILDLILGKLDAFDLKIRSASVLSAGYLEKHEIIAQHYGVINRIAKHAKTAVSESAKMRFESIFGEPFERAKVLGGLEIMDQFPGFTPESLDYLWQNGKFEKLAGGTYALRVKIDGEGIYLVNGFHPRQLQHFTEPGRCIVVFSLVGDLDWSRARSEFIGATSPADALAGSIRRELLEKAAEFGLAAVTPSWNGVHLSAGPIEGLIELIRYQSDFESGKRLSVADFALGRELMQEFGASQTQLLLENPELSTENGKVTVFDLTEEQNAADALALLKSAGVSET